MGKALLFQIQFGKGAWYYGITVPNEAVEKLRRLGVTIELGKDQVVVIDLDGVQYNQDLKMSRRTSAPEQCRVLWRGTKLWDAIREHFPLAAAFYAGFESAVEIEEDDEELGEKKKTPKLPKEFGGTIDFFFDPAEPLKWYAEVTSCQDKGDKKPGTKRAMSLSPIQCVFYGAPGTGKSFMVDEMTNGAPTGNVIRTTFHPDSDYASFVGVYKPTMDEENRIVYDFCQQSFIQAYVVAWNEWAKGSCVECTKTDKPNEPTGIDKAIVDSVNALIRERGKKGFEIRTGEIVDRVMSSTNGVYSEGSVLPSDYCYNRVNNGIADLTKPKLFEYVSPGKYKCWGENYPFNGDILSRPQGEVDEKIVGHCSQGVRKLVQGGMSPVVLVIEELNRGNCAQIFGDLFQLLDRNGDGWSNYPIKSDVDLAKWLGRQFKDLDIDDKLSGSPKGVTACDVKSGEKLLLPPNFYIWATMNTSDQSLFPIDSAFKRRWDWKYIPISKPDKSGDGNWKERKILVNSKKYDWWEFLKTINRWISKKTSSEDKQLGYFFVKANDSDGIIHSDVFVNKVLFYLYNDVFKDYDLPKEVFGRSGSSEKFMFKDFFHMEAEHGHKVGNVNESELDAFLVHLNFDQNPEPVSTLDEPPVTPSL